MNESNENFYLTTAPVKKLLIKFSIPCVLAMLVTALYNIVDQIFIGNSGAGTAGIMATTLVFPFTVLAPAIAQLICIDTSKLGVIGTIDVLEGYVRERIK